jgi:Domain of unknown function (DUF4258)
VNCSRIVFSGHAVRRMFQWGLGKDDIVGVVNAGECIAEYPDDRPYPSSLILGFLGARSVHVVVARDPEGEACYVVTAYVPDSSLWSDDFRTRRAP